jgi:hypothetical protein
MTAAPYLIVDFCLRPEIVCNRSPVIPRSADNFVRAGLVQLLKLQRSKASLSAATGSPLAMNS